MIFLAFIVFSILGLQLWNIQVNKHSDYEEKSDRQSIRKIRIPPLRGRILASDGTPIAGNRVSYAAKLHLSEMRKPKRQVMIHHILSEADRAAGCIGRENPLTVEKVQRHMNMRPGIPMDLFLDLSSEELSKLLELTPRIKGLEITPDPVRDYPFEQCMAHVLGYARKSDPATSSDREDYFYYFPDIRGVQGLEKSCDSHLCGRAGRQVVAVNSSGYVSEVLRVDPAVNGNDVLLTIDLRAQQIAESLLQGKCGSIVVLDASDGAVIAIASAPAFSPASLAGGISHADYQKLSSDPDKPFLNRSALGSYMPGSVIKPLCALAALENGIMPDTEINCTGRTPHGYGKGIACNNRYGHGSLDVRNAIKKSCNVFFVDSAVQIGIDKLSHVYASAGIGRETGVGIPEAEGFLPHDGPRWNESETAFVGFGQGKILTTPLQVANYFAAIANGGILWRPYLIKSVISRDGFVLHNTQPGERGRLAASAESIQIVREGMYKVVNEKGGSGYRARLDNTVFYGKTGTADVEGKVTNTKNVWFAGFAEDPVTKKTYSIAVLVERGDSGGSTAAPLAGSFFKRWFTVPEIAEELD